MNVAKPLERRRRLPKATVHPASLSLLRGHANCREGHETTGEVWIETRCHFIWIFLSLAATMVAGASERIWGTTVVASDPRVMLRRIRDLTGSRPDLAARYEAAKATIRHFRKPAFYEVTQRCNLKCEGCYYFESERVPIDEQQAVAEWERFFATEAQRQVSMAYFVGAEPALHQERLLAAAGHFVHGNVGTNGTIRIDPAIPFRISISMWAGDDETDRTLRGASAFRKAFRNYRGDRRAIVYYTLSHWNLDGARIIAEMCRDNGLPLTFNLYSPTATYLSKLAEHQPNDDEFFRVSRPDDTPMLSDADLGRAERIVLELMEDFPETVLYSRAYNRWSTRPGPLHALDAQGTAPLCGSRITSLMHYYGADLVRKNIKCCTPDLDCSQCRIMSGGWSTKLAPDANDLASADAFSDWLEMLEALKRIFVYEHSATTAATKEAATALH